MVLPPGHQTPDLERFSPRQDGFLRPKSVAAWNGGQRSDEGATPAALPRMPASTVHAAPP